MDAPTKRSRNRDIRAVRSILHREWPDCFKDRKVAKLPLKIGIYRDIREQLKLPAKLLFYALKDYTSGPSYLNSCIEGAPRVGLSGEAEGVVTKNNEVFAKAKLAKLQEVWNRGQA